MVAAAKGLRRPFSLCTLLYSGLHVTPQVVAALQGGQDTEQRQALLSLVLEAVGEDGYYTMLDACDGDGWEDVALHVDTTWLQAQGRPAMVKQRAQW